MTMPIDGFGIARIQQNEYTSGTTLSIFKDNLQKLKGILLDPVVRNTDSTVFADAISQLSHLAKNGVTEGGITYYMTSQMVADLQQVFQTIKAVGIDLTQIDSHSNAVLLPVNIDQLLLNWKSLAGFGIGQIFTNIENDIASTNPTRSLQSMVELEYVREGNEVIAQALSSLEQALELTQHSMDTLAHLQDLANLVNVEQRTYTPSGGPLNLFVDSQARWQMLAWDHNNSTGAGLVYLDTITTFYKQMATEYFSQLKASAGGISTVTSYELVQAKIDLTQQVVKYESANPGVTRSTVNSLPFFLYKIVQDISASFKAVLPLLFYTNFNGGLTIDNLKAAYQSGTNPLFSASVIKGGAIRWIIDNQDKLLTSRESSTAGAFYGHLTQAIKGSESLNDSKKQEVNNYMFLFQEFYKSSSAVLAKVSQIVEKMAQGISR